MSLVPEDEGLVDQIKLHNNLCAYNFYIFVYVLKRSLNEL